MHSALALSKVFYVPIVPSLLVVPLVKYSLPPHPKYAEGS